MVSHWRLSYNKSPQVSRTLLSILANLNNTVDGLHSSSYFKVFQFLYQSFGNCVKDTNYNLYHSHFHVPQFFSIPLQGWGTYLSFHFLSILLWGQLGQQSPQFGKFSFSCWSLLGLVVSQDQVISLYLKIP